MSTRGYLGIKKKGQLKGYYNHFDSYLEGLGTDIVDYLNSLNRENKIKILSDTFDRIILVGDETPTNHQIADCMDAGTVDLEVSNKDLHDWYCLLRYTQGDLSWYVEEKINYMLNGNEFLNDDISCEYGYVINLDTEMLDIYMFGELQGSYPLAELSIENIINDLCDDED